MDKQDIARVLGETGMLLDLMGENPFKVRAYESAARTLEALTEDLGELIENGRLTEIKGIGKNLAEHIEGLVKTGRFKEYEDLRKKVPDGVIQMLGIPGLGPRKVRYIWKDMGVETVQELELFCRRHGMRDRPGFGAKSEEKILEGIEMLKRFAGQYLYAEGRAHADEVLKRVLAWPETKRAEVAGSIRRKKEVIKDIDILVATGAPQKAMERFVSLPFVENVLQRGETKSEVILKTGVQCDLRAVKDEEFPFALHYFTGSKEHNIAVRALAKKKGMKLSEYGLFKGESLKSLKCKDEAGLFKALGLSDIEPELRENMGEIEAAENGQLPNLLELSDVAGLVHMHTNYSDGISSIEEMVLAAKKLGYSYIVIADHSQSSTIANGLKPADVRRQWKEIDALGKKLSGVRIFKGIEVDIMADGSLDYNDELLSQFEIVIASVHSRFNMAEDEMTARVIKAIANPHVDILGHPTGRLLLAREPYKIDLKKVIETAGKHEKTIEINCHPQRLDLDWRWHKFAKEKGVKLVLAPDAHSTEGFGDVIYGVNVARKGWLEKADILNCLPAREFEVHFGLK